MSIIPLSIPLSAALVSLPSRCDLSFLEWRGFTKPRVPLLPCGASNHHFGLAVHVDAVGTGSKWLRCAGCASVSPPACSSLDHLFDTDALTEVDAAPLRTMLRLVAF